MEISKIREMAKLFADIPIYDTRVGGVASHPFTNTWITGIYDKDRKLTLVDLRKEDEQAKWREQIKATIDESDLTGICEWHGDCQVVQKGRQEKPYERGRTSCL